MVSNHTPELVSVGNFVTTDATAVIGFHRLVVHQRNFARLVKARKTDL
jgi:hypothetical protein